MKPIIAGLIASIAAVGLLSSCGSDDKVSLATTATTPTPNSIDITTPAGVTLPAGITIPAAGSIPTDLSVPEAAIDAMITQLATAGMKVDKACFTELLKDDSLRNLVAQGGTPTADVLQKFFACIST